MENLKWDQSLSIGFQRIDNDHIHLIKLLNLLREAIESSESTEYIDTLFEEFIAFAEYHFAHEECLMIKHNYDGLKDHKFEHVDLIKLIRDLQQSFLEARQTLALSNVEYLIDWLKGHILEEDKRLGEFLSQVK